MDRVHRPGEIVVAINLDGLVPLCCRAVLYVIRFFNPITEMDVNMILK